MDASQEGRGRASRLGGCGGPGRGAGGGSRRTTGVSQQLARLLTSAGRLSSGLNRGDRAGHVCGALQKWVTIGTGERTKGGEAQGWTK